MLPQLKMIVVLRNPIDRAMSEYYMERRRIESQNEFLEKLLPEMEGIFECSKDEPRRLRRQGPPGPGGA